MSLHHEENAISHQLDALAAAELSSVELSGVWLNSLSPMKQTATCEIRPLSKTKARKMELCSGSSVKYDTGR